MCFERTDNDEPNVKRFKLPDKDYFDELQIDCLQKYNGKLDAFTINLNTLIYVLQKYCGFQVNSFMDMKIQ